MMDDPPIVECGDAPTIMVDGYLASVIVNDLARFTLFAVVHNPETGGIERRVVARLVMTGPVLAAVHAGFANDLKVMMDSARAEGERAN